MNLRLFAFVQSHVWMTSIYFQFLIFIFPFYNTNIINYSASEQLFRQILKNWIFTFFFHFLTIFQSYINYNIILKTLRVLQIFFLYLNIFLFANKSENSHHFRTSWFESPIIAIGLISFFLKSVKYWKTARVKRLRCRSCEILPLDLYITFPRELCRRSVQFFYRFLPRLRHERIGGVGFPEAMLVPRDFVKPTDLEAWSDYF